MTNHDFSRYLYLGKIWKDKLGLEEGTWSWKMTMQKEIFVQCLANMGLLCTPMFLQVYGYNQGGKYAHQLYQNFSARVFFTTR